MLYDICNPLKATRVFHDGPDHTEIRVPAGETLERRELHASTVERLRKMPNDLIVSASRVQGPKLPPLFIDGMWGIGDCLHQRAVVRELMKSWEVWLSTNQWNLHHDLVDQGLHLVYKETLKLRGQWLTQTREKRFFASAPPLPPKPGHFKIWYHKHEIDVYGSILETMFAVCKLKVEKPDLSFPLKPEWTAKARELIAKWNPSGLPLMIYRPIVERTDWRSPNRNPLPGPYNQLYEIARKGYFVVSLAYLTPNPAGQETVVGSRARVDLAIDDGSVPVEIMAAVVTEAQLVFCNPGFMPVMAQCVGTPQICVYGGRESFKTTQRAGAHMAPTLGVDVDHPCDCHTERHACNKTLTVSRWIDRVTEFAEKYRSPDVGVEPAPPVINGDEYVREGERAASRGPKSKTLIFATVYVDSEARQNLTRQWLELTSTLNPGCDILLVDSHSPLSPLGGGGGAKRFADDPHFRLFDFGDNIGHLSRRGRDGWGRAFCKGLELAIEGGYDYVAHIEGDSLLRLPVAQLIEDMVRAGKKVATTPVRGMPRDMAGWVETGLMVFDVGWVKSSDFVKRYDWPRRTQAPTPEVIVARQIAGVEFMLPIKAWRSDKQQITHQNVVSLDLDWITHCHNDIWCYDRFLEAALRTAKNIPGFIPSATQGRVTVADNANKINVHVANPPGGQAGKNLNLGCGTNKIPGWENHDADVDITKRLPWPDNSADFIFIEHCVEHVSYHQAIGFFEEAFRVLRPGGVLRVTVPSIEQIAAQSEADYWKFTEKWGGEATLKGALKAIVFAHGHQQAWTASLMRHSLAYAGFVDIEPRDVGQSPHAALRGVEGHGKVIGDKFNAIESMPFEGTKPDAESGRRGRAVADSNAGDARDDIGGVPAVRVGGDVALKPVAIVLGGASCLWQDLDKAKADCEKFGLIPTYFVTNDTIAEFPGECIAVSLHAHEANKFPAWMYARREKGYPEPKAIWSNRTAIPPFKSLLSDDWAGSSGLFAFKVARQLGFSKVTFCGVPMTPDGGHFKRGGGIWTAATAFQRGWVAHMKVIQPYARSYSGWTAEKIGAPDEGFFQ